MVSLLLNGFAGAGSAFVPEGYYGGFLAMRLISGIGVGECSKQTPPLSNQ